ncbi:MAG TPA: carboxypeptidase-like regulatory domain-containing protein [Vicinamibacterales bacterium]|nr:carboxypeptidase-like regulatory domain-containing protein [Vicinamibacterales bacterium]
MRARSVSRVIQLLVPCLLFLLAGFATNEVFAQSTGAISGRVTDPQGLALQNVTVTITNPSTGETRRVVTNDTGRYQITALPPGGYTLTLVLSGFRQVVFEGVVLTVGGDVRQDAQLQLSAVTDTVTVRSEVTLLNTTTASVGNNMNEFTIKMLPIEAGNVVHLLSLQPGAVFIPVTNNNTTDPRYGSVAGARSDQQNVTLDGVDVNDPQLQAAFTSAVRVTQAALQEFRVSTTNYGAEVGRSSGPQVSLITRGGTNRFAGSGYYLLRRTKTSTNEYFLELAQEEAGDPSKPPLLDKDVWGGAMGGPIRRGKLFFFANYEYLGEKSESPVTRGVPSPTFRDGVLQYQCAVASACPGGTVQGFTGSHQIASGWFGLTPAQIATLDPLGIGPSLAASQYFKQYPQGNGPGLDSKNIVDFLFSAPIEDQFKTLISRVDFKPSTNRSIFGRVNVQDDVTNSTPQFPGQGSATQTVFNNAGLAFGWDEVLSPSWVNSLRYGWTQIDTGTVGPLDSNFVNFRFISSFESQQGTSTRATPTHNIVNDLSWLKGSHAIKFGTNLRITRIPSTRNGNSFLSATVNPSWVDGVGQVYQPQGPNCNTPGCTLYPAVASTYRSGYADAWLNILGVLSSATVRANYDKQGNILPVGAPIERRYASNEYEFYVQDTWQAARKLTVTFGLRYSLDSPPYEVNGLQVAPSPSMGDWFEERRENMLKGIPSNASPLVTFDLAGAGNSRKGFYDMDKNNFAPRIAVAWTPTEQWVVRGGYSKVFDRIGHGIAANFDSGASFGMSTSLTSPFGAPYETTPGARFVDLTTMPVTIPAAPAGGFPQTPPVEAGVITTTIDSSIVTPSAHMVNALVGRNLGRSFTVEAGYVGRFGRDQLIRRDIAMPLNLVDTVSGMDYFAAAQQLITAINAAGIPRGSAVAAYAPIAAIPYWENLFPAASFGGFSATQQFARRFNNDGPDYITTIWRADQLGSPGYSKFGPFAYFSEQYDSLAALSSVGRSNYNAMILSVRKRYSGGNQFDFNYTLSRSKDMGSNNERGGAFGTYGAGGYSGFLVNTWEPELNYGISDFDVTHQFNVNGILDLPFGRGRRIGTNAGGLTNQLIGDWSVAGVVRWTSGFPFSVINCRSCWPTNWNLQGNATLKDPNQKPEVKIVLDAIEGRPSVFADATAARDFFRFSLPGEAGDRNIFRGDGYFTLDFSLSKSWQVVRNHRLRFRWDVFNLTDHVSFDVDSLNIFPDRTGFGRYDGSLATCDARAGRCMQFAFRWEF